MLLLFPELWEKFGLEMPSYEVLEKEGFPKDKTSNYFMEWLDCMHDGDIYPADRDIECVHWVNGFLESIEDKKLNHFCNILVHGYIFTGTEPIEDEVLTVS
jgi:hypothetical protein